MPADREELVPALLSTGTSTPRAPAGIVARLRAAGCVYADDEARLLVSAALTEPALRTMVDQRVAGAPLEHIVGWAEFCDLRVVVDPGVFVPRRRTEFLVQQAVAVTRRPPGRLGPRAVAVDLCCGSGAVGAALAAALPVVLHAVDIEPAAVRCARRNLLEVGGGGGAQVYEGDLYEPLPAGLRGHVDVLVANTPYVPSEAVALMPPEARLHEPRVALDGGADGLDVQRRVAAEASQWLAPGGHLLVETSDRQAEEAAEVFSRNGLASRVVASEELDATVVVGRLSPRPAR